MARFKVFTDPKRAAELSKARWWGPWPFDDNAHYGIQNRESRAVIVRNVNLVTALSLLDEILAGEREGR